MAKTIPFAIAVSAAVLLGLAPSLRAADYAIEGTLAPAESIESASLTCRATRKTIPIEVHPKTGRFKVTVPEPAAWDIQLVTTRGRIEGVNLRTDRTDLGLERKPADPLTKKDREFFADYLERMKTFENKKRILEIEGDRGWARVLVELIRDETMTLKTKKPSMTYRVEIWDFKRKFGTWRKGFERARSVQFRELLPIAEFEEKTIVFEPKLGGFFPTKQTPTIEVEYEIPNDLSTLPGHVGAEEE
jgi:hypothetical protein